MKLRKAVLIIHGFAGGVYDEEKLSYYLTMHNFDVYTFTLPGHDRIMFNKATKEEWIDSCTSHIEELIKGGYRTIYVIGHSMGGVLAAYLASKYKQVKKLVLVAPAFKYLTFDNDKLSVRSVIKHSPKIVSDYGGKVVFSRIFQFPTKVVKEFMKLVEENQDLPQKIHCKTLIIQGNDDEIVPIRSSQYVYDNLGSKKRYLKIINSTHDVFRSKETDNVCRIINLFLRFGVCNNDSNQKK